MGEVELIAGFATEAEALAAAAVVSGPGRGRPTVEPVDPRAWVDPTRRAVVEVGGRHLDLLVGGAFGDGHHPSTRLALELLAIALTSTHRGATVLDVGTGTGILALAARALGAAEVTALDNDPDALHVAGQNLAGHPDLGAGVTLTDGISAPLPSPGADRGFGVVVANVVLGTQRELAPVIGAAVAPGGLVLLSGLLGQQEAAAVALHPGLDPIGRAHDGDWLGLTLGRPAPTGPAAPHQP